MKKLLFVLLSLIGFALIAVIAYAVAYYNLIDNTKLIYTAKRSEVFVLEDFVKPKFNAQTENGKTIPIGHILNIDEVSPLLAVVEKDGKAKISVLLTRSSKQKSPALLTPTERDRKAKILELSRDEYYIDLLALKSKVLGEHPREKILRLHEYFGLPIQKSLYGKITGPDFDNSIFHSVVFEYLPGKRMRGIVSEVFPDGTLLVIPDEIPKEWQSRVPADTLQSKNPDKPMPTHFHVDSRALLTSDSDIGKEYRIYEKELLALPYEDQRNPSPSIAVKECDFYYRALDHYGRILDDIGFDRDIFWGAELENSTESISLLINNNYYGQGIRYFGFSRQWMAAQMRNLGFDDIISPCDKVSRLSKDGDVFSFVLTRTLEPDKSKRNIFMKVEKNGNTDILYIAPGNIMLLEQLPSNPNLFLVSAEGWPNKDSENPDPRWQSVYLIDITDPDEYKIVRYPLPNSAYTPEGEEHLYGHSEFISQDGRFFHALLYGFEEQGGGLWAIDLSQKNFYENKSAFAQIFSWDHALTFFLLPKSDQSPYRTAIMTGKEVSDDFAMTLNALKIKFDGLESELVEKERLIKMIGWNPVPFAYQWVSDEEVRVYVETYFNYESHLVPRVRGVYIVPISVK